MGWGFANQSNISFEFNEEGKDYVWEGVGYYLGSFKMNDTVNQKKVPEFVDDVNSFCQGVGRSLMYSRDAELERIQSDIHSFDHEQIPSLWRGVGIAFAYIRGFNELEINQLMQLSDEYKESVVSGIKSVLNSTKMAGTFNDELLMLSQYV